MFYFIFIKFFANKKFIKIFSLSLFRYKKSYQIYLVSASATQNRIMHQFGINLGFNLIFAATPMQFVVISGWLLALYIYVCGFLAFIRKSAFRKHTAPQKHVKTVQMYVCNTHIQTYGCVHTLLRYINTSEIAFKVSFFYKTLRLHILRSDFM